MLVCEMTAVQLYGVQLAAVLMVGIGVLVIHAMRDARSGRERIAMLCGLFLIWGLPVLIGFAAMEP